MLWDYGPRIGEITEKPNVFHRRHLVGSESYTEKREKTERRIERKQRGQMRSVESLLRNAIQSERKATQSQVKKENETNEDSMVGTSQLSSFLCGDAVYDEESRCLSRSKSSAYVICGVE
jgi:uridine kinase